MIKHVTIFIKDDCPYCDQIVPQIIDILEDNRTPFILTHDCPEWVTAVPAIMVDDAEGDYLLMGNKTLDLFKDFYTEDRKLLRDHMNKGDT